MELLAASLCAHHWEVIAKKQDWLPRCQYILTVGGGRSWPVSSAWYFQPLPPNPKAVHIYLIDLVCCTQESFRLLSDLQLEDRKGNYARRARQTDGKWKTCKQINEKKIERTSPYPCVFWYQSFSMRLHVCMTTLKPLSYRRNIIFL